jgi:hypothetical protein
MEQANAKGLSGLVRLGISGLGLLVLLAVALSAEATTLYRWIDSEGRMHFGDRPPPGGVRQAEELELPTFTAPNLPADQDPYSILNQLDRMQEQRENRERERRERAQADREYYLRQRELELREQQATTSGPRDVRGIVHPIYPWRPIHRPGRPGHRPGRPGRPPGNRLPGFGGPDHPAFRPRPPYVAPHPPVAKPLPSGRGATIDVRR